MNKKIMGAVAIALFALPFAASASVVCNNPDHPVYDALGTTVVSCISDAAWQVAVDAQESRAAQHLPIVPSGTVLVDAAGIKYQVPNIVYPPGWVDLTHTVAYENAMRALAQLQPWGAYAYWLTH